MSTVFTAGSYKNGKAAYGVWFGTDDDDERKTSGPVRKRRTNNRAELVAILEALKTTKNEKENLLILSSSQYCVKTLNEKNECHKNQFLINRIKKMIRRRNSDHIVEIKYVKGIQLYK